MRFSPQDHPDPEESTREEEGLPPEVGEKVSLRVEREDRAHSMGSAGSIEATSDAKTAMAQRPGRARLKGALEGISLEDPKLRSGIEAPARTVENREGKGRLVEAAEDHFAGELRTKKSPRLRGGARSRQRNGSSAVSKSHEGSRLQAKGEAEKKVDLRRSLEERAKEVGLLYCLQEVRLSTQVTFCGECLCELQDVGQGPCLDCGSYEEGAQSSQSCLHCNLRYCAICFTARGRERPSANNRALAELARAEPPGELPDCCGAEAASGDRMLCSAEAAPAACKPLDRNISDRCSKESADGADCEAPLVS